jgi:hypothetical protein
MGTLLVAARQIASTRQHMLAQHNFVAPLIKRLQPLLQILLANRS